MKKIFVPVILFSLFSAILPAQEGAPLSLGSYLDEVRAKSPAVKATRETSEAMRARSREGELLFAPQLFGEAQYQDDRRQQINSATMGTEQIGGKLRVGVSQQTRFGLQAKVTTGFDTVRLEGTSPQLVPLSNFVEGHHQLELSQSLLRNSFGSEVQALEKALRTQAEARGLGESFKTKVTLVQAEAAYWRLAATREAVRLKEENFARATQLREWNARRERLELGKRGDLLQAEASLKLAALDLQAVKDDERIASTQFNTARGVDAEAVAESLEPLVAAEAAALEAPKRDGEREDVRAAERARDTADAQATAAVEKNRASLDVFALVALNGRDANTATGYGNAFSTQYPTLGAGLRFSMPLSFGLKDEVNGGYRREAMAADLGYRSKQFEVEREWRDLEHRFTEARRRLDLALAIESAQKEKFESERRRQQVGQSTTFQVLSFQQDFAAAQLQRVRFHADVLTVRAQMKLFGGVL